jgi:acyl carrier protein
VLDDDLNPAPPGVRGEIFIGGANVARGYFGQPAQTAERFVPDPFGGEPGARLYRSGDSARYLPGGDLEFLGRRDQQSKIRGYRVEPGEVEKALAHHEAVETVVVVAREDAPGETRLVAYVVPARGESPDPGELRNYARGVLPDYMTPSKFVLLDALPLTPGGKIDRRSLPAPDSLDAEVPESAYVAPSGEVEGRIAAIWREALQAEKVSADESFFDLGGHSLILLRVQGKLRNAFERDISIVELFEHPTIRLLARHLSRGRDEAAPSFPEMRVQAAARRRTLEARKRR